MCTRKHSVAVRVAVRVRVGVGLTLAWRQTTTTRQSFLPSKLMHRRTSVVMAVRVYVEAGVARGQTRHHVLGLALRLEVGLLVVELVHRRRQPAHELDHVQHQLGRLVGLHQESRLLYHVMHARTERGQHVLLLLLRVGVKSVILSIYNKIRIN
jgi:hypothetical protein